MRVVFGLFWFWCGALWMVLIATTIRPKLAEAVRHARITSEEASAFLRGLAISIGLLCSILGLIALTADQPAPFCIEPFSFDDWPSAASNVVTLIAWAALLGWVWLGSGADLLGRMAPAFMTLPPWRRRYLPWSVRVVVTLLLAAALVGSRTLPQERPGICSAGADAAAGERRARVVRGVEHRPDRVVIRPLRLSGNVRPTIRSAVE